MPTSVLTFKRLKLRLGYHAGHLKGSNDHGTMIKYLSFDTALLKLLTSNLRGHVKEGAKVRNLSINLSLSWILTLRLYSKDAQTNPRGIPYAPFVDKVEDYVATRAEVDGTMKNFQEMIS